MTRVPWLVAGMCLFASLAPLAEAQGKKEITVVTGKVKTYEAADPALVTITTGTGEIQAELAPATYLKEQRLAFNPSEEITVRGFEEIRSGRRLFIVTEVTTKEHTNFRLRRADDLTPVWTKTTTETITPGGTRTTRTVKGKIKTYERGDPSSIMIVTDTGDLRAELGPSSFIEGKKLVFTPNEDITLQGFEELRDGRRSFIVTEVTMKEGNVVRLRNEDFTPVWTRTTTETRTVGGPATGLRVVKGKIRTFERRDPAMVTVITESGDLQAELAPFTYLEEQKLVFNTNDEITLRGYEETRDGRRIFIASEVSTRERPAIRLRNDDRTPAWKMKIKDG